MKQSIKIFYLFLSFTLLFSTLLYAKKDVIHLSIFPYLTVGKVIQHNKELKDYLSKELHKPVSIVSARSIPAYVKSIKNSTHQLILAPPHVGRLAQVKAGYQPIAIATQPIQVHFVVKKNSPIKTLSDAKGKTLSMAPPKAIIHQLALEDLHKHDLYIGKNISHLTTKGHVNALFALLKGKSDIAITGNNIWTKITIKQKNDLRILYEGAKAPGFIMLGHKSLTQDNIQKIRKALLKFNSSNKSKNYLFKSFTTIEDKTLKSLDKYLKMMK